MTCGVLYWLHLLQLFLDVWRFSVCTRAVIMRVLTGERLLFPFESLLPRSSFLPVPSSLLLPA